MSLGYNDLQDLIQNQRALAELVNLVKAEYDIVLEDIDFAKELEKRIDNLNTSMETILTDFDERIAASDERMEEALKAVETNAQELKDAAEQWVSTLEATADGQYTVQSLYNHISQLQTLVSKGIYDEETKTWSGGLEELYKRLADLEERTPSIVITEEGTTILLADRLEGVLYGTITETVRDIGSGQTVKISPSLQGVIVS